MKTQIEQAQSANATGSAKRNPFVAPLNAVPACQTPDKDTDWFPAVDVTNTGQEYVLEVDLPELKPQEIQLSADSKPRREGLELLVIWSFSALSFAALFFALYVIWAKCEGNWPF